MHTQWILARKPPGGLPTDEDFTLVETPIPEPGAHQMLTRTIYLSLDPYQWGRKRSGLEAVGDVCHGRTVSQVVKSNVPEYSEGDFIFNTNGWQEYGLSGDRHLGVRVYVPTQARPGPGAHLHGCWHHGHARSHGLLRDGAAVPTPGRRDRGGVGGLGRRGADCRTDCRSFSAAVSWASLASKRSATSSPAF